MTTTFPIFLSGRHPTLGRIRVLWEGPGYNPSTSYGGHPWIAQVGFVEVKASKSHNATVKALKEWVRERYRNHHRQDPKYVLRVIDKPFDAPAE